MKTEKMQCKSILNRVVYSSKSCAGRGVIMISNSLHLLGFAFPFKAVSHIFHVANVRFVFEIGYKLTLRDDSKTSATVPYMQWHTYLDNSPLPLLPPLLPFRFRPHLRLHSLHLVLLPALSRESFARYPG